MCVCVCVCEFSQPLLPLVECDTESIFKQSKAGLNSDFSFSQTGSLTEDKEPSLSYYVPIVGEWRDGFMLFPSALT